MSKYDNAFTKSLDLATDTLASTLINVVATVLSDNVHFPLCPRTVSNCFSACVISFLVILSVNILHSYPFTIALLVSSLLIYAIHEPLL